MPRFIITAVGSRTIPKLEEKRCILFFEGLVKYIQSSQEEYKLYIRSGGAKGCDTTFSDIALKFKSNLNIYRNKEDNSKSNITSFSFNKELNKYIKNDFPYLENDYNQACSLASREPDKGGHPYFTSLKPFNKGFMIRNSFQVLGSNLKDPSDVIICWTPTGSESYSELEERNSTGGTDQCIRLACAYNIPIINLGGPFYHRLNKKDSLVYLKERRDLAISILKNKRSNALNF